LHKRKIWAQNGLMLNVALWQKNAQGISNGIGFNKDWNNPILFQLRYWTSKIILKDLRSILESPSKPWIKYWILQLFKLWHFQDFCQRKMTLNKKLFSKCYNSQNGGNLHPFNTVPWNWKEGGFGMVFKSMLTKY
jgi:hypothetical protein